MPPPVKVSWSALKRWKKCSWAQKLVMEGKSARAAQDGRQFLVGNLCDHSMRRWLEVGDFSVPIESYLRKVWVDNTGPLAERPIKWRSPDDQQVLVDRARGALRLLEDVLRENVLPYEYEPEMRFTSRVGIPAPNGETIQVELFGAVDIAVRYAPDVIGIWDLKLSESRSYITSSIGQLVLYDLAIRNWLGVKPQRHGFIAPLLPKEILIPLEVKDSDRLQMISDVTDYAHSIWGKQWSLTEDESNCFRCEVKHACIRHVKPIPQSTREKNLLEFGVRDGTKDHARIVRTRDGERVPEDSGAQSVYGALEQHERAVRLPGVPAAGERTDAVGGVGVGPDDPTRQDGA